MLTAGEKIKIIMKRTGVTVSALADSTAQTRQNLSNKFSRDNFTEKELRTMAEALGCEVAIEFRLPDGTTI